jgi:hypothetical protein
MDLDRIGWEVDETYSKFCQMGGRNISGVETTNRYQKRTSVIHSLIVYLICKYYALDELSGLADEPIITLTL